MKKLFVCIISMMVLAFAFSTNVSAETQFAPNSKSAILIEATTQRIIFEKEPHLPASPASMTKIMSLILIFEALDNGKITMDDIVTGTEEGKKIGGTTIYLDEGEEMTVKDLIKSVAIGSANDATYALAVYLAGSEAAFVEGMNQKAKALGCENTNFVNSYGFDHPDHYSSAYDIAIMSAYLIKKYPEALNYTSQYEGYVRENDPQNKFWLVNPNKLVKFVKGVDGLKTGRTDNAKFCMSATILKNDVRFIAVVMGCDTSQKRSQDVVGLLNYATSNYDVSSYLKKGDIVTTLEDVLIQPSRYNVVVSEDINILKRKGEEIGEVTVDVKIDNLKIRNLEEVVGTIDIYYNGKLYKTADLVLSEPAHRSSFFDICLEVLKELFLVS